MKPRVKVSAILLVLTMALTILLTGLPAFAAAEENLPFVEVNFYLPQAEQVDQKMVQDEINKILRPKYNCDLIIHPIDWAQWSQNQQMYLSSGEGIDMIYDAPFLGYWQDVGRKSYLPLDDLLQKYGQGIIKVSLPAYLESGKVNGVTYGVACNKDMTQDMGFWMIKELGDKLGITAEDLASIKYLEDMEPLLEKAKKGLPDGISPIYVSITRDGNFKWLMGTTRAGEADGLKDQQKNYLFRDDFVVLDYATGETKPIYEYDSFVKQCELLYSWFQKGYINSDAATSQMTWDEAWKAGKALMSVATLNPMQKGFVENGTQIKVVGSPINLKPGIISDIYGGISFPVSCKNPERAMMILNEFYTNADLMNLFTYGIEGVHYNKVSANVIKQSDKVLDYSPGSFWMIGNWFIGPEKSIYTTDTQDPNSYKDLEIYNKGCFVAPTMGFTFDTEPVKNEIAAHRNVLSTYMNAVANGVVDPATAIEMMRQEDKAAGIDKILEAYKTQYLAFKG